MMLSQFAAAGFSGLFGSFSPARPPRQHDGPREIGELFGVKVVADPRIPPGVVEIRTQDGRLLAAVKTRP